jgi:uncharacterized protein YaaQ
MHSARASMSRKLQNRKLQLRYAGRWWFVNGPDDDDVDSDRNRLRTSCRSRSKRRESASRCEPNDDIERD